MLTRRMGVVVAFLVLSSSLFGDAKIVVELIPDNPGPYVGGESLTVHVWLHSQFADDFVVECLQLDYSNAAPELVLDPTFAFDFSSTANDGDGYLVGPDLPIVWASFTLSCTCFGWKWPFEAGGSLHIGSVGVELPIDPGRYHLDVLNAGDPFEFGNVSAFVRTGPACLECPGGGGWTAFPGEVTGGVFDFVVPPPIAALSQIGLGVMACLLLGAGVAAIRRKGLKDAGWTGTLVGAFVSKGCRMQNHF